MNTPNSFESDLDNEFESSFSEEVFNLLERHDKFVDILKNFWVKDWRIMLDIFSSGKILSITQIDEYVLRIEYYTKNMYNRHRLLIKSPTKTINLQAPELELQQKYEFSLRYEKGDSHIVGETQWQKYSLDELDKNNDTSWVF